MKNNPKNKCLLFFQIDDDFQISNDSRTVFLKKPRILGYILKPVQNFPLYSSQIFNNQNDSCEEFFSATDNFTSLNEIRNFKRNQFILSDVQQIKVLFINKHDYKDKYFENFENLYRDCIFEWTQNLKIKASIV